MKRKQPTYGVATYNKNYKPLSRERLLDFLARLKMTTENVYSNCGGFYLVYTPRRGIYHASCYDGRRELYIDPSPQ